MAMMWHRLVFLHWAVDPGVLRAAMPEVLRDQLDTFDGQAWLGVVPFDMSGIRARGTPALPGVSAFPELNLRTYWMVSRVCGSSLWMRRTSWRCAWLGRRLVCRILMRQCRRLLGMINACRMHRRGHAAGLSALNSKGATSPRILAAQCFRPRRGRWNTFWSSATACTPCGAGDCCAATSGMSLGRFSVLRVIFRCATWRGLRVSRLKGRRPVCCMQIR